MIAKQRIWEIREYDKYKAGCLAAELGISPLVTGILLERGLTDTQFMREFLYGSATPFHDPFLMKDMDKTVARLERAIADGEKITVYGDYDVDGITASSLLYIYLQRRGACVSTYIPQRKSEGYGLNDEALQNIAEAGTTLVVTVDCGISGLHEVENAPKTLDIIITDHHTVPEQIPPAYAIINPKQADCRYPFKDLSGVGVAFKLCQALEQKTPGQMPTWQDLTELTALGTVADIVPLVGENRELVRRGLKAMENTSLVGLRALIKASGCPETGIAADNIGFGLAPRLNAVGRLEHAQSAVELLVTSDPQKAERIAAELNRENALRQEISRKIMEDAEALLAQEQHIDTAIVLAKEGWHQGVIGIVASRLVDKYHLPTILISIDGDMAKGSCRSIPALNLYEAIAAESDILTQFGGHHQAAGLTLPAAKVQEFRERFRAYVAAKLQPADYLPHLVVDCVVPGNGEITIKDLQQLQLLEPCGCANMPPIFAFRNALLHNHRTMGKEHQHLQFVLDKGDYSYRCVMWNSANLMPFLFDSMIADVAFQPKINVFRDETTVQLHSVSVEQGLTLGDYRSSSHSKYTLLQALGRTHNLLDVYVAEAAQLPEQLEHSPLRQYFAIHSYSDLANSSSCTDVVLLDIPTQPVSQVIGKLKEQGAKNIFLLYQNRDAEQLLARLAVDHPKREMMVAAYSKVMELLKRQPQLHVQQLVRDYGNIISENAVKIMEQLGFITVKDDIIKIGVINPCRLEDAPLFNSLQQERQGLETVYRENLRISQHDLLRGER